MIIKYNEIVMFKIEEEFMEYFDILNKDGSKSGLIATKGEELSGDQYYLGVHAYIHNLKGEFLLQKRSEKKDFYRVDGIYIWDMLWLEKQVK